MLHTSTRLLHDGWSFRELKPAPIPFTDVSGWLPAEVPGHVHLDLMRAGVIPDPFERMYERTVQWIDETSWTYRCTFDVSAEELGGARQLLRFCGLDTLARILLNDELLGEPANMFVAHEFDVTAGLRRGRNSLELQFSAVQQAGEQRMAALLDAHPELAPYARGLMPRSFVRKAQYMYGWDWGPCLRGCGIWQDVQLVRVPVARIKDWSYRADFSDDGACRVTVWAGLDGAAGGAVATLSRGETSVSARSVVQGDAVELNLDLAAPERWWPAGYGDPALYDLVIAVERDGETVDTLSARVGLRTVELVREPDARGESFFFRINGVAVFAKGANWIPADSFPARVTPARYRDHVELARGCGMNMLRVWGGGLYETEPFYAACDELGLLVWQDFPYACALYPDDDATAAAAYDEAAAAVRRLRHHPSLVLYCGNNENQMLAHYGLWGELPRVLGDRLYDEVLPRAVADEDPTRPYWPGSPYGSPAPGSVTEADPWAALVGAGESRQPNPNSEAAGDCHYWNVWHGAGDWRHYAECSARFISEFGFAAPPDMRTFDEALPVGDQGVDTPAMRWHDKTLKGYETYLGFIALHYPAPTTLPDLVYYGQLNQAEGMKFGIEHFRRRRPHTMGTLVWQLNDCWPVQSWAWVDFRMRPKAAWYYARRFYAPLLLSLTAHEGRLSAYLVNDGPAPREGTLQVRAVEDSGAVLWHESLPARVDAGTSALVWETDLPAAVVDAAGRSIVHATFADVENTLLLVEPKELRLGVPRLRVETSAQADGLAVTLETDRPALAVMLWLDGADAVWSDNYFDLLPGVARTVTVRPAARLAPAEMAARLRWRAL